MNGSAWSVARIPFLGALLVFVSTVVIGILNGIDVYSPDHDTLMGHVHSGTLGWITQAFAGVAILALLGDRVLDERETRRARGLAWSVSGTVTLYVAAFYAGDLFPDRIQRPITGTLLLLVLVWFARWLFSAQRHVPRTVARLGLRLAGIAVVIGAVFGIVLGLVTAGRTIPGISSDIADGIAGAHPPAMVVGFLLLAAMAIIEWLLGDVPTAGNRAGVIQMWLLFLAGLVLTIAFVFELDEQLAGPANLMMIVGVVMLLVRRRKELTPAAWRGAGTGAYPRMSLVFLIGYMVLLTVIVARFVSGAIDPDAMSPEDEGLLIAFDHVMFLGVMTLALFGTLATRFHGTALSALDRFVLWGVSVGVAGFAAGLILLEQVPKRVFTPILGVALLVGIGAHLRRVAATR